MPRELYRHFDEDARLIRRSPEIASALIAERGKGREATSKRKLASSVWRLVATLPAVASRLVSVQLLDCSAQMWPHALAAKSMPTNSRNGLQQ